MQKWARREVLDCLTSFGGCRSHTQPDQKRYRAAQRGKKGVGKKGGALGAGNAAKPYCEIAL